MQASLNWPLAFINNYLLANGTATMLCPAFHGWSMNLGRHNHGPVFFNGPWSGSYRASGAIYKWNIEQISHASLHPQAYKP